MTQVSEKCISSMRSSIWNDRFLSDWDNWPSNWPLPRDIMHRFHRDSDRWWRDWPSDWPQINTIVPRFSSQLDRFDRNWRQDPFWRDLYPRWAEPIFKEGIDVKTNIVNDQNRFAVDIDTYQFRPEELQVKTLDDTLLIEGRHEDIRDSDNYTKMYFVRKYQLPTDVAAEDISSSIDSRGRLIVEARKRVVAIDSRERNIPIEGSSRFRTGSRSSSYSPRDGPDSGLNPIPTSQIPLSAESRLNVNYSPPKRNSYRNEYSSRSSELNGMRHETHSKEFREEVRRSTTNLATHEPIIAEQQNESQHRNNSYHNNSLASSRNDFRVETPDTDHILRPPENLNERTHSRTEQRSVRIQRTYN